MIKTFKDIYKKWIEYTKSTYDMYKVNDEVLKNKKLKIFVKSKDNVKEYICDEETLLSDFGELYSDEMYVKYSKYCRCWTKELYTQLKRKNYGEIEYFAIAVTLENNTKCAW